MEQKPDVLEEALITLRSSLKIPARRNGLRHGFASFHYAMHSNENLTAAECGNSPAMIHKHYKKLTKKAEAKKWFNIRPTREANVIPLPERQKQTA